MVIGVGFSGLIVVVLVVMGAEAVSVIGMRPASPQHAPISPRERSRYVQYQKDKQ